MPNLNYPEEKTIDGQFRRRNSYFEINTEEFHIKVPEETIQEAFEDIERASTPEIQFEPDYPRGPKLYLLLAAVYSSIFVVALDRTIIATVFLYPNSNAWLNLLTVSIKTLPTITNEFHSLHDQGWYAAAYLLSACSVQLLFGRIYKFYSTKVVFLIAMVIFETGSLVCGAAPNSTVFIIGRVMAGIGSAGIFSGNSLLVMCIAPLNERPKYTGMMGSIFGVASVLGPIIGGITADTLGWRWCFYVDLPIGVIAAAICIFCWDAAPVKSELTLKQQLLKLDPLGTAVFIPGIVCSLIALQWAGNDYSWDDPRIIALFVTGGVLLLTFVAIQVWLGDEALLVPRILCQRSIACAALFAACVSGVLTTTVYYLPVWFQAVKGQSAVDSGIDILPLVTSQVIGSMGTGFAIAKYGQYVPFMLSCSVAMSLAVGLMTRFTPDTKTTAWIGIQILLGYGIGSGMQQPSLAAQVVLDKNDISIGIAIVFFAQTLGGTIFVSIAQSLFTNSLGGGLEAVGISPQTILNIGATELKAEVAAELQTTLLAIYNSALVRGAMLVALTTACISILPALGMEWLSVKGLKHRSLQSVKEPVIEKTGS